MLFLDLMRRNVEHNLTPAERRVVRVCELKWGTPLPDNVIRASEDSDGGDGFDLVLASDCVYLESAFEPLLATLGDLLGPHTEALIVSKRRRKADKRFFVKLRKQFVVSEVTDDPNYARFTREGISIVRAVSRQYQGPRPL
ncbi:hypothetical protein HK405_007576 [Cladochytrium tenue]|nr:hypothetical protein HK405_007576 [Cladochytrium tenue]